MFGYQFPLRDVKLPLLTRKNEIKNFAIAPSSAPHGAPLRKRATVTMVMRGAEYARRCIAGGGLKRLYPNSGAMSILPWAKYAFVGRQSGEAGLRPESPPARSKRAPRPLACANVRVH